MCNPALAYAAMAVAAVGGGVAQADAARKAAHAAQNAPPPPPPPTAEALVNPESATDPASLSAMSRRKLKVDLSSPSGSNIGAGLMVPTNT